MFADLNLNCVEADLHPQAREAFADGDGPGFVWIASGNRLQHVVDNMRPLKERGIYEASLLTAFTGCKTNHYQWPDDWLDTLFGYADPVRLRQAGESLPGTGPFVLYRGVSGTGRARRLRGYSWTASLDVACWFAVRFPWLAAPTVLMATVPAEDILAYWNDRGEQEFLWKPLDFVRLKLTREEIAERATVRIEGVQEEHKARFAKIQAGTEAAGVSI